MTERRSDAGSKAGWAEHTVVANLPRLFPGARSQHAPLANSPEPRTLIGMPRPTPPEPAPEPEAAREPTPPLATLPFALAEEPRTVVGRAPSQTTAQQLLARYAELASAAPAAEELESAPPPLPLHKSWFRRAADFAQEDFRRAPRIVRLLLPALPLVAAATTFLDVDPAAPALSRAVAVAATTTAANPEPALPAVIPLPVSSVTIAPRPGHTLASDAADAAARGDREQAIALYAQLARERPDVVAYASAARILMRDEARNRPHSAE